MRGFSTDSDSSSDETNPSESRPQRSCRSRTQPAQHNANEESDSEEESEDNEDEFEDNMAGVEDNEGEIEDNEDENSGDNSASESAHSSSKNSSRRQSVNKSSSDEDSDVDSVRRSSFPSKNSVPQAQEKQRRLVRPGVEGNSYDSKCNEEVKRKVSNISYNPFPGNKYVFFLSILGF